MNWGEDASRGERLYIRIYTTVDLCARCYTLEHCGTYRLANVHVYRYCTYIATIIHIYLKFSLYIYISSQGRTRFRVCLCVRNRYDGMRRAIARRVASIYMFFADRVSERECVSKCGREQREGRKERSRRREKEREWSFPWTHSSCPG